MLSDLLYEVGAAKRRTSIFNSPTEELVEPRVLIRWHKSILRGLNVDLSSIGILFDVFLHVMFIVGHRGLDD